MDYRLSFTIYYSIFLLILTLIPSASYVIPHSSLITPSFPHSKIKNYRNDRNLISNPNTPPLFFPSLSSSTVSLDPKDPMLSFDVPPYRKKKVSDDFIVNLNHFTRK